MRSTVARLNIGLIYHVKKAIARAASIKPKNADELSHSRTASARCGHHQQAADPRTTRTATTELPLVLASLSPLIMLSTAIKSVDSRLMASPELASHDAY
jgi:hypothetical protein